MVGIDGAKKKGSDRLGKTLKGWDTWGYLPYIL